MAFKFFDYNAGRGGGQPQEEGQTRDPCAPVRTGLQGQTLLRNRDRVYSEKGQVQGCKVFLHPHRYGVENSKECFMARLTLTLQAEALSQEDIEALPSFRGIKKAEWEKVRAVTYHSREELVCAICLEKDFRAPQMTHCGHVFCWPCIYMHHFRCTPPSFSPKGHQLPRMQRGILSRGTGHLPAPSRTSLSRIRSKSHQVSPQVPRPQ